MNPIFLTSLSIAFLLTIWLKSNALAEYVKKLDLLNFCDFLGFPLSLFSIYWLEIEVTKTNIIEGELKWLSFLEYLNYNYPNSFWVKLIGCPICLAMWGGILSGFFVGFQYFLVVAFLSCFFYYCLAFLIRKSHE